MICNNKYLIFQKGYKKDTHIRGMGISLSLVKKSVIAIMEKSG